MNNKLQVRFIATIATVITSMTVAIAALWKQSWFGVGDLNSFGFWTLPLVAVVFFSASPLHGFLIKRGRTAASLLALIIGLTTGILWTVIVAIFLGPWFGAFSFPVIACWAAGGIAAFLSIAGQVDLKLFRRPTLAMLSATLLGIIFIISYSPVRTAVLENQRLEVLKFTWQPGDSLRFRYEIIENFRVSEIDSATIANTGVRGTLTLVGISMHGSGARSKAILILQHPVKTQVTLLQPDRTTIAYLQTEDNKFRMYPPSAKTLQRVIELSPDQYSGISAMVMVELAGGAMQGGSFAGSINVSVTP